LKTDHRSASAPARTDAPPPIAGNTAPPAGLIAAGVALGLTPGLQDRLERGADRFRDRHA
jgi:hypothetical protein